MGKQSVCPGPGQKGGMKMVLFFPVVQFIIIISCEEGTDTKSLLRATRSLGMSLTYLAGAQCNPVCLCAHAQLGDGIVSKLGKTDNCAASPTSIIEFNNKSASRNFYLNNQF